jgi:hypothetical protein
MPLISHHSLPPCAEARQSLRHVEPNYLLAREIDMVMQVTSPIFPLSAEGEGPNELVQGKNIIDAAKEAGVKFFIFRYIFWIFRSRFLL